MTDIARATIIGRLTKDPELNDRGTILNMSLACNYRKKSGDDWNEEVSFFDVVVFGNRAKGLHSFLVKGRQVAADCRVVQERWEKDGNKRSAVRFYADEVMPIGSKGEASDGGSDIPANTPVADDDIPF